MSYLQQGNRRLQQKQSITCIRRIHTEQVTKSVIVSKVRVAMHLPLRVGRYGSILAVHPHLYLGNKGHIIPLTIRGDLENPAFSFEVMSEAPAISYIVVTCHCHVIV
jgi:hypothetical protein